MLIPSIDLMDGKAVQLKQGKIREITSLRDPVELAEEFSRYGTPAVIDLDAAMGKGSNMSLVKEICRKTGARAGGGIRSREKAIELLRAGASRVILGSSLWDDFVLDLPKSRIQAAIDSLNGKVMVQGWTAPAEISFHRQVEEASGRASSILCTFIEREGTMKGLSPCQAEKLKQLTDLPLTVAGGVSDTENAVSLMKCGVDVQVGMSLYRGELDPAAAVTSFLPDGLTPTVVEDEKGQLLMVAWSSTESLAEALRSGTGTYFSRSRKKLWRKGETSGNTQKLLKCRFDCDGDTLLFTVNQNGCACHTGSYTCFGEQTFGPEKLQEIISARKGNRNSYTGELLDNPRLLRRKVIEEAAEVVFAREKEEVIWEAADLVYFLSVLITERGCTWNNVWSELEGRSLL